MGNMPDTGLVAGWPKGKKLRSGEGGRRARSRVLASTRGLNESRTKSPRNILRDRRGKSRRHGRGIEGVREVTEEAALICVMVLAGRCLLSAGRATGHDRTLWRRSEPISLRGTTCPTRCKNLHQQCQQKNWNGQSNPAPQHSPPVNGVSVTHELEVINRTSGPESAIAFWVMRTRTHVASRGGRRRGLMRVKLYKGALKAASFVDFIESHQGRKAKGLSDRRRSASSIT